VARFLGQARFTDLAEKAAASPHARRECDAGVAACQRWMLAQFD
jgi:hypothetical protein